MSTKEFGSAEKADGSAPPALRKLDPLTQKGPGTLVLYLKEAHHSANNCSTT